MRAAVVIVVRDDPRIDACLRSVYAQTPSFDFDVVVVDNGSRPDFADRMASTWSAPTIKLLEIPGRFGKAWNEGAKSTPAEILVRLDSDCMAHPGWLERLVRPLLERPSLAWTAGPVVGPEATRSLTQRYYHYRTLGYQERLAGDVLPTDAVPSWNVAYRREAFDEVGGYDERQEGSVDWDLHKRFAHKAYTGFFVRDAVLTHDHPLRLRDFYRNEAKDRTGHYQMMVKYGLAETWDVVSLPGVYVLLAAAALWGLREPAVAYIAGVLFGLLVLKQWLTATMEHDRTWILRPFFRLVEAVAALHGLLRGFFRYGLRRGPTGGTG